MIHRRACTRHLRPGISPRSLLLCVALLLSTLPARGADTREKSLLDTLQPLTLFGRSFFTAMKPAAARLPVSPGYLLGPGDEIILHIWGELTLDLVLPVSSKGYVLLPDKSRFYVNGLRFGQLKGALLRRLRRSYASALAAEKLARGAVAVEVTLGDLHGIEVFVTGEVEKPGAYSFESTAATLMEALAKAGGLSARGSLRRIRISSEDGEKRVDLYDFLLEGRNPPSEYFLRHGDLVFVPLRDCSVAVRGGVRRPAVYELVKDETLEDLLRLAGGTTPDADSSDVRIARLLPGQGLNILYLDLAELEAAEIPLQDGDQVEVRRIAEQLNLYAHEQQEEKQYVRIEGHVKYPGLYSLSQGLSLRGLLDHAGGFSDPDFRRQTYMERGFLVRLDSGDEHILSFDVDQVLSGAEDLDLQSDDRILIYGAERFKDPQYVEIKGPVRAPGRYPFRRGMKLEDLLLAAGGLREEAYVERAEVARLSAGESPSEAPIRTLFVNLETGGDFELRRGDLLFVRRLPGAKKPPIVALDGEVAFPGQYTLGRNDEHLSQLIRRAGGLTPQAFPGACHFTRLLEGVRRPVALDMGSALKEGGVHDIILMDGDSLYIPAKNWVIQVKGAVLYPQVVQYIPGKKARFYIEHVGGYRRGADRSRTYIIRANQLVTVARRRFWFDRAVPPGSTIVVPAKNAASESPPRRE